MPDLTTEIYWCCQSCQEWSTSIESDKTPDKIYAVRFDATSHHNKDLIEYDYSCSCEFYKHRRGKYCKHIKAVKHLRCGWNSLMDGDEVKFRDGSYFCPWCGREAVPVRMGV